MVKHTPYTISDWLNYLSHAEIDFLGSLASSLPINPKVVNVGAGGGTSAVTFLSARADIQVFTIEIQDESSPLGSLAGEKQALIDAELYDEKRYMPIHGDSKEIGLSWPHGLVDMVFVDGDHSYVGASGDISIWLNNLRDGGIIAVHDYQKISVYRAANPGVEITDEVITKVIKPWPGVDRAVFSLLVDKHEFIGITDTLVAYRKITV